MPPCDINLLFYCSGFFFFSSYQTSCLVTSSNVQVYSSSVEQRILERQLKEETKQPKCPIHLLFVFLRFLSGRLFVNLRFGKELDLFSKALINHVKEEGILLVKIFIETQNALDCKPLGGQLKNNTLHKCSVIFCVCLVLNFVLLTHTTKVIKK